MSMSALVLVGVLEPHSVYNSGNKKVYVYYNMAMGDLELTEIQNSGPYTTYLKDTEKYNLVANYVNLESQRDKINKEWRSGLGFNELPNDPKIQMPNNGNPTLTQSEMFTAFAPIGAGLVTGLTSKYYYKRDTKKSLMYGLGATIGAGIIAHLYDSNLYPKLINSFAG